MGASIGVHVHVHFLVLLIKQFLSCFQRWMRAKLQRKRYLEEHRRVVMIQRAARTWLARRHRAATVIQRAVQGLLLRRRQERMQRGIIMAQVCQ